MAPSSLIMWDNFILILELLLEIFSGIGGIFLLLIFFTGDNLLAHDNELLLIDPLLLLLELFLSLLLEDLLILIVLLPLDELSHGVINYGDEAVISIVFFAKTNNPTKNHNLAKIYDSL